MPRACLLVGFAILAGCSAPIHSSRLAQPFPKAAVKGIAAKVVEGAKLQLVKPASYDASYRSIPYPNGDVPADRGACTDVVIRALRHAGYDLQKLVHEDMKANLSDYPVHSQRADPNIDQRRVPNLRRFFAKFGLSLDVRKDWRPGDIVTWKLASGKDHTGVVVNDLDDHGTPLVVHNLRQTAEEDVLFAWMVTGHYRFPKSR
ncbi:MAG TPA: DUF1287 domain-containing protein [Fimbriimonadaceae bacterium]|nr:DUF1287 domain-containing protein [Fimbriimonadaceae bacterium]